MYVAVRCFISLFSSCQYIHRICLSKKAEMQMNTDMDVGEGFG